MKLKATVKSITAFSILMVMLFACKKETAIAPPTVKVFDGAIRVSYTTANVAAEVTDQGGAEVRLRGFVYGLSGSSSLDTVFCGSGLGVFSAEINNLLPNTTYFYEAIARNAGGTGTSGKVTFTTQDISMPTVKTGEVTEVTTTTALCGGEVTNDGGATVSERGVCLSTQHNPSINDRRFASGQGLGAFSIEATGLLSNTTYYVRAYAINAKGVKYGEEKSFDTDAEPVQSYSISVAASPSEGGTVSGGGTYQEGQSCTVEAVAKQGYTFTKWTEDGNEVSSSSRYMFVVNGNRTLVANFKRAYTITVSSNPSNGGTTTGGGTYTQGETCVLIATAAEGYTFVNWTENGNSVSTNPNYSFTVNGNRTLVANYAEQSPNTYNINVSADPRVGGTVTGGGAYQHGQSCTVSATANLGYTFLRWTENGQQVSANSSYTFTVNGNRTLVALFQAQGYTINVSANPSSGGTVSGGGSYNYGQNCTVTATAATGYTFLRWTENGQQVSTNSSYTFTVNGNRTLVAQFQAQGYTISVSANPSSGGTVSGGGNYNYGQSCTVTASAATGYAFLRWTENGSQVSTNASYTFTVNGNRSLVANFTSQSLPTVTTSQVTNIQQTTAVGGGNVTNDGGASVTERGVCWSLNHNPTISDNYASNGTGTGSFTVTMTGLAANTTYYVRAYATNSQGTSYGGEVNFTTQDAETVPTVTISQVTEIHHTMARCGGSVTDSGNATVIERGICWSTNHNPTINGNYASNGTGTGYFVVDITGLTANTTYYVRAYAINSVGVGYSEEASFITLAPPPSQGALNGLFTINSSGKKVYFSRGNLQYRASTATWRFATNQYDYIGEDNSNISMSYSGWIDLFGWGTSGWNCGNYYYRPWESANYSGSQYGPTGLSGLLYANANSDWGYYNMISNGGNTTHQWRTLKQQEWDYVLNTRSTSSGIRYAKARVNNVNGVILVPDDWSTSTYELVNINAYTANFIGNVISASQWTVLENAGAVFLPAAGYRDGTMIDFVNSFGYYWSASCGSSSLDDPSCAYCLSFSIGGLYSNNFLNRSSGFSVRLVSPAELWLDNL